MSLLPPSPDHIRRDWLILWHDVDPHDGPWWPSRFVGLLKPGFRHVFCARRAESGNWLVAEWTHSRFHHTTMHDDAWYSYLCGLPMLSMLWVRDWMLPPPPPPIEPATCVTAVKRTVGIYAPTVVTPWQLWRHLGQAGTTEGRQR